MGRRTQQQTVMRLRRSVRSDKKIKERCAQPGNLFFLRPRRAAAARPGRRRRRALWKKLALRQSYRPFRNACPGQFPGFVFKQDFGLLPIAAKRAGRAPPNPGRERKHALWKKLALRESHRLFRNACPGKSLGSVSERNFVLLSTGAKRARRALANTGRLREHALWKKLALRKSYLLCGNACPGRSLGPVPKRNVRLLSIGAKPPGRGRHACKDKGLGLWVYICPLKTLVNYRAD